jgi:hypothetical protein
LKSRKCANTNINKSRQPKLFLLGGSLSFITVIDQSIVNHKPPIVTAISEVKSLHESCKKHRLKGQRSVVFTIRRAALQIISARLRNLTSQKQLNRARLRDTRIGLYVPFTFRHSNRNEVVVARLKDVFKIAKKKVLHRVLPTGYVGE